jgi:hypothetical protein
MINLLCFYKEKSDGYYSKFCQKIISENNNFILANSKETIDKFKNICKPPDKNFKANNSDLLCCIFGFMKRFYCCEVFKSFIKIAIIFFISNAALITRYSFKTSKVKNFNLKDLLQERRI